MQSPAACGISAGGHSTLVQSLKTCSTRSRNEPRDAVSITWSMAFGSMQGGRPDRFGAVEARLEQRERVARLNAGSQDQVAVGLRVRERRSSRGMSCFPRELLKRPVRPDEERFRFSGLDPKPCPALGDAASE
jgi:hypothetical protein